MFLHFRAKVMLTHKHHFASCIYTRKPLWRAVFRTDEALYLIWETEGDRKVLSKDVGDEIPIHGRLFGETVIVPGTATRAYKVGYINRVYTAKPDTEDLAEKAKDLGKRKAKLDAEDQKAKAAGRALKEKANSMGLDDLQTAIKKAGEEVRKAKDKQDSLERTLMSRVQKLLNQEHTLVRGWWDCPDSPVGLCLYPRGSAYEFCVVCGDPRERK